MKQLLSRRAAQQDGFFRRKCRALFKIILSDAGIVALSLSPHWLLYSIPVDEELKTEFIDPRTHRIGSFSHEVGHTGPERIAGLAAEHYEKLCCSTLGKGIYERWSVKYKCWIL